jgi:hypothetical protein
MKKKTLKIIGLSVFLVLAVNLFSGCSSPKPWNLNITKTTPASIQVDLIGVKPEEKPGWEARNLDKYWGPDGALMRRDAQPLSQTLQKGVPWRISVNDSKWQEWLNRGCTEVLVLANLPGSFESGPADPRRRFLPLVGWKTKGKMIEIEVRDTMIQVLTPNKSQ